jgi:hypothetical protein
MSCPYTKTDLLELFGTMKMRSINLAPSYMTKQKTNDLVIPYQKEIDQLFDSSSETNLSIIDADMLLSSLYIVYAQKSNSDSNKKLSYDAMLKDFLNYSTIEKATVKTDDDKNLYD